MGLPTIKIYPKPPFSDKLIEVWSLYNNDLVGFWFPILDGCRCSSVRKSGHSRAVRTQEPPAKIHVIAAGESIIRIRPPLCFDGVNNLSGSTFPPYRSD